MGKEITNFKMTELGPLPKDWEVVRLGDYCRLFSGYAFRSSDFVDRGILVVKIGNLQNGTIIIDKKTSYFPPERVTKQIEKYKLCKGDILIALTGATTGKIAVVPDKFEGSLLNQRVGKFEIFSEKLDKDFFRYLCLLNFFQEKIKENILQSAQGNISPKQIEQIKIPLPPLPEQKAMARMLRTIQEAIEATERVIAAAKELKKSLMRHLFTYGPVPVAERDRVRLKQTEIGPIPEDWEVVRLGDLNFDISDGNYSSKYPRQSDFVQKGIPFIRAINIQDGKIVWKDMKYITIEKHNELQKGHLKKDDILITTRGDIGKVAIVSEEFVGCNINAQIVRINTSNTQIYSRFLFYNFIFFNKDLQSLATGSTLKQLPISRLLHFKFPFPPLPIQQKIARILKAVDDKIEAEEKKKKALQAFFKTMLHHLMTGKIRVKIESKNFSLE